MSGNVIPATIGKFRVLELLGEGAMGRVFLGEDPLIGRRIAIKVMTTAGDENSRERFLNEARAAGQLSHPNIVQVYEFGFHEERPYLAMEFLEGQRLDQWLTAGRRHPREKMTVLLGLSRAIEHAHSRGVLHRDVKPSNLQVLPDGTARL
ncbi:MAG: serine/threonine protein kinase, partial [Acidobacteria bacterium]|nr:serine/threonine protein kinase [Acidobacteriota bacterium]